MLFSKKKKKDSPAEAETIPAETEEETEKDGAAETGGDGGRGAASPLTFEIDRDEKLKREFEEFKVQKILHRIDHTLLRQDATDAELRALADEAEEYGFYAVCVQPAHVALLRRRLGEDSKVKLAAVVGFPMGENLPAVKAYETKLAVRDGADEIDMVLSVSAVRRGDYRYVRREIQKVVAAAKRRPVKVILEVSLLGPKELERAAQTAAAAGATFVKTSTGYFGAGATAETVRALRAAVGGKCSVKASGGIRTAEQLLALLDAGADRIGTSSGVAIAKELREKFTVR